MDEVKAGQPEIIRSHQKDDFFQASLKNDVSRIIVDWFGPKCWMKYQKEISLMTQIGYFYLTTVSGFQTLGEEYCNLIQMDKNKLQIPTLSRRSVMILLQCFAPYMVEKLFLWLRLLFNHHMNEKHAPIKNVLDLIQQSLPMMSRIHLALFYMQGEFYAIGKRITGVQYALIRDFLKDKSAKDSYQFLGKLLMGQFLIMAPYHLYSIIKNIQNRNGMNFMLRETCLTDDNNLDKKQDKRRNKLKCPLCLDPITDLTTTSCGHLFCWDCIVCSCAKKLECPVCRDKIIPSKLVYLCHFET